MRNCVTHHFACDCREEKFKALEKELVEVSTDRDGWKHNCDDMDELIHSLQKELALVKVENEALKIAVNDCYGSCKDDLKGGE